MFGKDGLERAQALGRFDVANDAHNDHGWCFDDGHCLDGLFFVQLGADSVDFTNDVRHAGLVAHECGQMHRLGGIVFRESLYFTAMSDWSLFG